MQIVEWQRVVRYTLKGCTAALLVVSLVGCAGPMHSPLQSPMEMAQVGPGDAVDPVRTADLMARFTPPGGGEAFHTGAAHRPELFPGADTALPSSAPQGKPPVNVQNVAAPHPTGVSFEGPNVEINFDNADVQTVAKAILTDTLGMNVVVDPRVQGNITLISSAPVARKDLLPVFENVLRMSNAAVLRDNGLVKIVPLPEAAGAGKVTLGVGEAGFGVTIVPLRYTSAATVVKTAENFLSRPGALRADTTRNILMIQGTESERQNVVDLVSSFDVEWLRNQSVGIYPLKSTSPDTMIHELEKVFETAEGGQGQGLISFQPVTRMNAVMAVAHNRKFLDQATMWIKRLDRSEASGTTVRIYRLEHGNAPKIARILNEIFVGRGAGAATDSPTSQLAPNTNGAQSRLDAINVSNNSSNSANNTNNTNSSSSQSSNGLSSAGGSSKTAASFDSFADKKANDGDLRDSGSSLPRGVFPNVRITADASNNSVVIYSNQEDYRVIERSLRELDKPQLQVEIEATVAEVTLTDALQWGVQYYLGSSDIGAGPNKGSVSLSASTASAVLSQSLPGLNVLLGSQASPKVILSALSQLTSVKVLSAPTLVVTDNQPAFLQVGDSVPISTGSATVLSAQNTVVNTITMQDTGVILKVWPHVHSNGAIELEVEQEVSSVVGGTSASGSSNLNPTISERRIHSTVSVASGQTVLLGGMISQADNNVQSGIPLLRQIRGIGDLFGNTDGSKSRTEIIVFVKPRIIRDGLDAEDVAQQFRAGLKTMHSAASVISGRDVAAPRSALVTK